MMSVSCVDIFWVVNASSGEKSCVQFSIPTGSEEGREGGVSNRRKGLKTTPKVSTQKSFFFSISGKIIIFF